MRNSSLVALVVVGLLTLTSCSTAPGDDVARFCDLITTPAPTLAVIVITFDPDAPRHRYEPAHLEAETDNRIGQIEYLSSEQAQTEAEAAFEDQPQIVDLFPEFGPMLRLYPINASEIESIATTYETFSGVRDVVTSSEANSSSPGELLIGAGLLGLAPVSLDDISEILNSAPKDLHRILEQLSSGTDGHEQLIQAALELQDALAERCTPSTADD